MIYNTKKVTRPRHWADLLDSRYKGQVTVGHPAFSGVTGAWVVALNDKYGWTYFEKLAQNQPKIGRSINDTVADVVSGERLIGAAPIRSHSIERPPAARSTSAFPTTMPCSSSIQSES